MEKREERKKKKEARWLQNQSDKKKRDASLVTEKASKTKTAKHERTAKAGKSAVSWVPLWMAEATCDVSNQGRTITQLRGSQTVQSQFLTKPGIYEWDILVGNRRGVGRIGIGVVNGNFAYLKKQKGYWVGCDANSYGTWDNVVAFHQNKAATTPNGKGHKKGDTVTVRVVLRAGGRSEITWAINGTWFMSSKHDPVYTGVASKIAPACSLFGKGDSVTFTRSSFVAGPSASSSGNLSEREQRAVDEAGVGLRDANKLKIREQDRQRRANEKQAEERLKQARKKQADEERKRRKEKEDAEKARRKREEEARKQGAMAEKRRLEREAEARKKREEAEAEAKRKRQQQQKQLQQQSAEDALRTISLISRIEVFQESQTPSAKFGYSNGRKSVKQLDRASTVRTDFVGAPGVYHWHVR